MRTGGEEMIELNTFSLEKYSGAKKEHREVINSLKEDVYTRNTISRDLNGFIEKIEEKSKDNNDNLLGTYVAYKSEIARGICGIDKNGSRYETFQSILPEYRGEGFDFMLEDQFEEYLTYEVGLKKIGKESFIKEETPVKKRTLKQDNKNQR